MRFPSVPFWLAPLSIALLLSGCPEENKEKVNVPVKAATQDAGPTKRPGKHAKDKPEDIQYPSSNEGLNRMMRDLKTGIKANDEPEVAVLLASLILPNDKVFFQTTFGDKLGATLSKNYTPLREEIGGLAPLLREKLEDGLSNIETSTFANAAMQTATGYQNAALEKMKSKAVLYSVRFVDSDRKRSFHLWSFVHFEGSFRFVGKLSAVAKKKPSGDRDLNEYRMEDAERLMAKEK